MPPTREEKTGDTDMHNLAKRVAIGLASATTLVGAYVAVPPTSAAAATARTLTNCSAWNAPFLGTEFRECLTANDWYDGHHVATNWNSDGCSSELWLGFLCFPNSNRGHYWNRSIGANTDYAHRVVVDYLITGTTYRCVNVNINTRPNGDTWYSNSIYVIGPSSSC
jgi:hypothetical protein